MSPPTQKEAWSRGDALRSGLDAPVQAQAASSDFESLGSGASAFDGANDTPARSMLVIPTNSWKEHERLTRTRLVEKTRALEANLPMLGRIKGKIAQHAVGKGIFVRPVTRDVEWNDEARRLFEEWAGNPGVYSIDASRDHYEDQTMVAESTVGDGEYLAAMVDSENGAPMVQPLDVFECETPFGLPGANLQNYVDGVRLNAYNRRVAYSIRELQRPGQATMNGFREVPANSMLHVFRQRRAKQARGLTWFFSGVNQGIDALDLRALVTGTAKLHEALAVTVKKNGKLGRKGALDKIRSAVTSGTPADEDFRALEKVFGGGMVNYLGAEGDVKLLSSDRPGQNIREFILFLYAELALATQLPFEVIYSLASLGGATARGALEDAQWLFEMMMDKIIWRHSFPLYRWRIARFVKEGRLRPCKDPVWWATSWRGPAKLTVDIGRTADANIKLLRSGAMTYSRYYDERSLEVRDEWRQQIQDLKWLQAECDREGVDMNRIIEPTPGTVTNVNIPEQPKD
jgi:capsid protein